MTERDESWCENNFDMGLLLFYYDKDFRMLFKMVESNIELYKHFVYGYDDKSFNGLVETYTEKLRMAFYPVSFVCNRRDLCISCVRLITFENIAFKTINYIL